MCLGVLYCVISKLKFYSKNNYQETFISKAFYFSVAFLIKVFSLQQTWIQQLQFIFSQSRTTSLCESHREFHYSTVTASMAILSCAVPFIESLFKLWNRYKRLFKLCNTNFLSQNMGHSLIQIMEHYKVLLKLWDTSETMAYTVKIMSISTCTSRFIFPQQKSVKYSKTPIIWRIPVSDRN